MTDTEEPQRCKSLSWTDKIRCIRPAGHTGDHTNQTATDINQIMWIDNPATGSDTTDSAALREQYAALAFNAVAPALKAHDHWLPLTVRQAVAAAVLAVRDRQFAALKRAHVALAAQAGRDQAAVDRVGSECDRIEAAVRANPQDPDFDGAYLAAIGHIRAALQPPAPDGGPTVAEAAADDRRWFDVEKEGK